MKLILSNSYFDAYGNEYEMFDKIGVSTYLGENINTGSVYTFNTDGTCITNPLYNLIEGDEFEHA